MELYPEFVSQVYTDLPENGKITCTAPSNIALIKYWGKKEVQIPKNPSLSFTLDFCKTETKLEFQKKTSISEEVDFELFFEGQLKPSFRDKITTFFERINPYLPFLKSYKFTINTSNTFPHSSGIASSASGMSALAFCLVSLEKMVNPDLSEDQVLKKSSFLARLGSGSASRSIEGPITIWGEHAQMEKSSNLYAIKYYSHAHPVFQEYQDTILLIDKGKKEVSSTIGHDLMHGHPFAAQRFDQAHKNLSDLSEALTSGDLKAFIQIVESEALTLHAMMMTSLPYFMLMKPNTLEVIQRIWNFRRKTGANVCFTLDAGANVHILYPKEETEIVKAFITKELVVFCENGQYICDKVGLGAKLL